jgi:hypothetical protein
MTKMIPTPIKNHPNIKMCAGNEEAQFLEILAEKSTPPGVITPK